VDSFSSDANFISVTPGCIQRRNGRGVQVVRTYWPNGLYVLADSGKFVLLKDLTRAATVGQGGRRSHGGYLELTGCSVRCLGSLYEGHLESKERFAIKNIY
jgi:hypothetical protein